MEAERSSPATKPLEAGKLYKLVPRKMSLYNIPIRDAANNPAYLRIGSIGMFLGEVGHYYKFLVGERVIYASSGSVERTLYEWEEFKEAAGG